MVLAASNCGQAAEPSTWVIPEPKFMVPHGSAVLPIPSSPRTVLARLQRDGDFWVASPISPESEGKPWQPSPQDVQAAEQALAECKITWLRDQQGIKEGAVLDGEAPYICAAIFAPSLLDRFADVFGPEIYLAIPSRFRIYLFPKLATELRFIAPLVLSDYRAAIYPVSPELFQLDSSGLRAVGVLDDR